MQLSSVIVNIMKKTGHVADVKNPITGDILKSVGSLFVDDANIFVYGDRRRYKSAGALYVKVKETTKAWALLLRATGGALKPIKCFWWLIGYTCVDGKWEYENTAGLDLDILGDDNEEDKQSLAHDKARTALEAALFGDVGDDADPHAKARDALEAALFDDEGGDTDDAVCAKACEALESMLLGLSLIHI